MAATFTHPVRALSRDALSGEVPVWRRHWVLLLGAASIAASGAAWAAYPSIDTSSRDSDAQWRALTVKPMTVGGSTGIRMIATAEAEPIEVAPVRAEPFVLPEPAKPVVSVVDTRPLRVRGNVGDGLYSSLRMAGATPEAAAQYLVAIAGQIDLGEVGRGAAFDLVLGPGTNRPLLYAGLDPTMGEAMQLVRWDVGGRSQWIDAASVGKPATMAEGMLLPAAGRITSTFGNRVHPILRFTRFHAGLDIGASWGSPIVAAGDGQVVGAGWAGGYGRQVRIVHSDGLLSSYSHMSDIAVAPGSYVQRGQVIGYVGSSGLSTGPHLHFEVRQNGTPINPLGVRITSVAAADPGFGAKIKARLAALLRVGTRG